MCDNDKLRAELYQKLEKINAAYPEAEGERIDRAFQCALGAHGDQCQRRGEPYIIHPIATAVILKDLGLAADSIFV